MGKLQYSSKTVNLPGVLNESHELPPNLAVSALMDNGVHYLSESCVTLSLRIEEELRDKPRTFTAYWYAVPTYSPDWGQGLCEDICKCLTQGHIK